MMLRNVGSVKLQSSFPVRTWEGKVPNGKEWRVHSPKKKSRRWRCIKLSSKSRNSVKTSGWDNLKGAWQTELMTLRVCIAHNTSAARRLRTPVLWWLNSTFFSLRSSVARHSIRYSALGSVDPDDIQVAVVDTLFILVRITGAALLSGLCFCCLRQLWTSGSPGAKHLWVWETSRDHLGFHQGMGRQDTFIRSGLQKNYCQYLEKHDSCDDGQHLCHVIYSTNQRLLRMQINLPPSSIH